MNIANKDKERAASRHWVKKCYDVDIEHARALSRRSSIEFFEKDPKHARALAICSSKASYEKDKEHSRETSRSRSKKDYAKHRAKRTLSKKVSYQRNPLNKLVASKRLYAKTLSAKSRANKAYYAKRRNTLYALRRDKYALAEPLHNKKVAIQRMVQANILGNKKDRDQQVKLLRVGILILLQACLPKC